MCGKRITTGLLSALVLLVILLQSGCGGALPDEGGKLIVAVSILPQKYFVEKIVSDSIDIVVVVPPGANPATYEPSPSDMRNMSSVNVWFTIGVPFESPWLPRFTGTNPDLRIRSTIENIERLPIDRYGVTEHETSSEHHSHSRGSTDPHVWLSPELVRSQAAVIADELSLLDSSGADIFAANLNSFSAEIDSLQNSIRSLIGPSSSGSFIVFHPAWGYFADEFNLVQIPIETAGSEPSPREMSLLIDYARENDIRAVFVSPQFSTSSAEAIAAEIGVEVKYIDPLAEDWSSNLYNVAELLSGTAEP
ncbi:MAG: zinc ABC transporter substrate-binding protein [Candidatus Aegiribacteria sp.]|nr:zinc ABC transporter substrate-binding protein [Candidatus Aegiribacteria sp.]